MATKFPGQRPDAYLGTRAGTPPNLQSFGRAPTTKDFRNFVIGDIWHDTANEAFYLLTAKKRVAGELQGTWVIIAGSPTGTPIETITTNLGGPVGPTAGGSILENASTTTYTDGLVANTVKTEVQAANNAILVGAGTNSPATSLAVGAAGVPLIGGASPAYGTATVPGGGTGSVTFAINGAVRSGATTTSPLTSDTLDDGEILIGATGAPPIAAAITAGTGINVVNGVNSITISTTGGVGFSSVVQQVFLVNGTYTPTLNMQFAILEVVGAGGGGGGANFTVAPGGGGGGGGGGYARAIVPAATIGASQAITIGAGGAGGLGSATGSAGGTSSIGAILSASGGAGGDYLDNTGARFGQGGAGGGGIGGFNITGSPGNCGVGTAGAINYGPSGEGGSSYFGGGAQAVAGFAGSTVNGLPGDVYGGGGSGASTGNTAIADGTGGTGANGVIVVTEFID